MARAIGSSIPSRAARPKPASPPILRLHNPSILTRARSARPEHVTSHSHGKGAGWPPSPWLPLAPFYSGTLVPFYGSSFFCVHSLRLNKLECSTRICCDKQSLFAVPIFVGDETADGILPVDPTALSWTFRWSSRHRSNRPFKSSHNLVRPAVRNSGILPRLPGGIPACHYWCCLGDLPCCPVI